MFKKGFQVSTPHGKGVVLASKGYTNTTVRLDATWETIEVPSKYVTALPVETHDGCWLPAKAGSVSIGQSVMLIDNTIVTVVNYWGSKPGVWFECDTKPKHHQVYALRVFVPNAKAYSATDATASTFEHFESVKEDAIWKAHWKSWAAKFQTTHNKAITNYCGNWYAELNRTLRKGTPASEIKYCDRLDAALAMGTTERNMIVWRTGSRKFDTSLPVGATFSDAGFGSCTIRKSVAQGWGSGVIFEIRVPKGSKGGYVGSGIASQHTSEYEFILPRNCTYRIVKIEKPAYGRPLVTCDLITQEVWHDTAATSGQVSLAQR